jgi:hypothetical protein
VHLLLQIFTEAAVTPDEAEIRKDGGSRDEDDGQQEPAAAVIRESAHEPEADGDEKCGERGKHRERSQRIALNGVRTRHEPPRCTRCEHSESKNENEAHPGARRCPGAFLIRDSRTLLGQTLPFLLSECSAAGRAVIS